MRVEQEVSETSSHETINLLSNFRDCYYDCINNHSVNYKRNLKRLYKTFLSHANQFIFIESFYNLVYMR